MGYINLAHLGHSRLVVGRTQQLVLVGPSLPRDGEISTPPIDTYCRPLVISTRKHWVLQHDLLAT